MWKSITVIWRYIFYLWAFPVTETNFRIKLNECSLNVLESFYLKSGPNFKTLGIAVHAIQTKYISSELEMVKSSTT